MWGSPLFRVYVIEGQAMGIQPDYKHFKFSSYKNALSSTTTGPTVSFTLFNIPKTTQTSLSELLIRA